MKGKVKMFCDSNIIEKKFREARKVTVPEELMEDGLATKKVKRGKSADIQKIRYILQNWDKPSKEIVSPELKYGSLMNYKCMIRSVINGTCKKLPRGVEPIISEYAEAIRKYEENKSKTRGTEKVVQAPEPKNKADLKQIKDLTAEFITFLKSQGVSEFTLKFKETK